MRAPRPRDLLLLAWLLPPAMGVLATVEALSNEGFHPAPVPLIVVAAWIPAGLILARWFPTAGAVMVAGFYPAEILLDIPGPGGIGLISTLLAVGWAGFAGAARRSLWGLGAAMLIFAVSDTVRDGFSWVNVFFPLIFVAAWWSGALLRRERRRSRELVEMAAALDAQREAMAQAAVIEERTRIAREIHDAVAHSVSIMTLQIGGLRRQLDQELEHRPAEREVLHGLERLGRQSVDELRALVGIMRQSGVDAPAAPAPSLALAEQLIADVRAVGLSAELRVEGDPEHLDLHRALDVSAYRVLQEALTNVLRHAPGSHAEVTIRYAEDAVTVQVSDDGAGGETVSTALSSGRGGHPGIGGSGGGIGGHGLMGMRERTAMFGGTLQASPRDGRGFAVTARFPIRRGWQ